MNIDKFTAFHVKQLLRLHNGSHRTNHNLKLLYPVFDVKSTRGKEKLHKPFKNINLMFKDIMSFDLSIVYMLFVGLWLPTQAS